MQKVSQRCQRSVCCEFGSKKATDCKITCYLDVKRIFTEDKLFWLEDSIIAFFKKNRHATDMLGIMFSSYTRIFILHNFHLGRYRILKSFSLFAISFFVKIISCSIKNRIKYDISNPIKLFILAKETNIRATPINSYYITIIP